MIDYTKSPIPYFGGKRNAAPLVWERFGDPGHFVDPFCGSLAMLLMRPHVCNRTYFSETVNDADGFIVNAWRSIQAHPQATAEAASWPVSEADLHARHLWLLRWAREGAMSRLMGDPSWCDPQAAGWWIWGQCCWIGGGWCSGRGPWVVDAEGRFTRRDGKGEGVKRVRPHLTGDGRGVNHPKIREEGVSRQRPHLTGDGQGVNHPKIREEGVSRQFPHIHSNGQGVNRPQIREEGVKRQRPHLGNNGQGVNKPQFREEGVKRQLPHLTGDGQGVNHAGCREDGVGGDPEFHPMTMPELRRWFDFLSARIRHVRILNGDWARLTTRGATISLSCDEEHPCGVFLDPPYGDAASRDMSLYSVDSGDVAGQVRQWCLEHGDDPLYRIALCGFSGEGHEVLKDHGWTEEEWFKAGFLTGGMGNIGGKSQASRDRIWFSPHCLRPSNNAQCDLFGGES